MIDSQTAAVANAWWARDFDIDAGALRPSSAHVQAHAGRMHDAPGIWILVAGGAPLVTMPEAVLGQLGHRARGWTAELIGDAGALAGELSGLTVMDIIGPAFIGYGTADTLDLSAAANARGLTAADGSRVDDLRAACTDEEWSHGGSDPDAVPVFGAFDEDGGLAALAGYKDWAGEIAHIAVVSAPGSRGHGHGRSAVAAAAQHALNAGLLPQYRTLADNAPSMAVARRIGFAAYGFSVFVRLAPA